MLLFKFPILYAMLVWKERVQPHQNAFFSHQLIQPDGFEYPWYFFILQAKPIVYTGQLRPLYAQSTTQDMISRFLLVSFESFEPHNTKNLDNIFNVIIPQTQRIFVN